MTCAPLPHVCRLAFGKISATQGIEAMFYLLLVVCRLGCLVQPPPPLRESRIPRTAPNTGPYSGFSEPYHRNRQY